MVGQLKILLSWEVAWCVCRWLKIGVLSEILTRGYEVIPLYTSVILT